jgi:hypothetical protein
MREYESIPMPWIVQYMVPLGVMKLNGTFVELNKYQINVKLKYIPLSTIWFSL